MEIDFRDNIQSLIYCSTHNQKVDEVCKLRHI